MPANPEYAVSVGHINAPKVSSMSGKPLGLANRPLSFNSCFTGVNTSYYPQSNQVGRSPSPPTIISLMNSSSSQQLPPACGARQLSKLKRFLTTLQQFGSDISQDIGERVRTLVLGLVNSHLSIEEFHAKLQQTTNFPLRPFVIPFLKANLPLLQRELLHCAHLAKQSPQQFLTHNEHIVFNSTHLHTDKHDSVKSEVNENGKRPSPDRPEDMTLELPHESSSPAKRHHGNFRLSPVSNCKGSPDSGLNTVFGNPTRYLDVTKSRDAHNRDRLGWEHVEHDRSEEEKDRERHISNCSLKSCEPFSQFERLNNDWRHVESMLNCIIGMVDKTKKAISVLQERNIRDSEQLSPWSRKHADIISSNIKIFSGDAMTYTLKQTEDRLSEVRRNTEDVIQDVSRQAMFELQKTVSSADSKTTDFITTERLKMERILEDTKTQIQSDLFQSLSLQKESTESCWNCGRKAYETCSGCSMARYCGSFCQHKDWDNHHLVCGKTHIISAAETRVVRRVAVATSTVATTGVDLGRNIMGTSLSKESPSPDQTSPCLSHSSSVNTNLVTKDNTLVTRSSPVVTSTHSPSTPSPRTLSPTKLNTNNSTSESSHVGSSAYKTSSADKTSSA